MSLKGALLRELSGNQDLCVQGCHGPWQNAEDQHHKGSDRKAHCHLSVTVENFYTAYISISKRKSLLTENCHRATAPTPAGRYFHKGRNFFPSSFSFIFPDFSLHSLPKLTQKLWPGSSRRQWNRNELRV